MKQVISQLIRQRDEVSQKLPNLKTVAKVANDELARNVALHESLDRAITLLEEDDHDRYDRKGWMRSLEKDEWDQ